MCLGSLSCWKVNLLPSLRFWMLWTGFSLRLNKLHILVHWTFFLLWWVPQSLLLKNSPTSWGCYQHTLLLGWYSAGDEQSWFPSNVMLRIEVHQTRESCFSQSEGPLGAFLQIPSVFSCVFTEERIEFGHTAIKAQIGGVLLWCLSFCRFLLSPHMIMELTLSDNQVLGHHTNQSPSPSIAQFGQEASSRKNPGCFKLLLLRVTETTCICDPSMQHIFSELFSRCVVWCNPVSELYRQLFLTSGLVFCSDMHYQLFNLLLRRVPFQIIPIQLNLPQVNSTQSVVTSISNMNAPELNFNCPR